MRQSLLDTKAAAAILGVSPRTLETLRSTSSEGPPHVRVGRGRGAIRYRPEDLEAYIVSRLRRSTSDDGTQREAAHGR